MNHKKTWLAVGSAILGIAALGTALGSGLARGTSEAMYVDSWTGGSGVIYYTGGDVGVGTSTPSWQLQSSWSGTNEGAVYGYATSTSGTATSQGVQGRTAAGLGYGVYGYATDATGNNKGVLGQSDSSAGIGVYGYETSATGTTRGVYGTVASSSGAGVYGDATSSSGATYGARGVSASSGGTGVWGQATSTSTISVPIGVYGLTVSDTGFGVFGENTSTATSPNAPIGIEGAAASAVGVGVLGYASHASGFNYGVYGVTNSSTNGYAGFFAGNVHVNGTLSKSAGSFKIDHPLDPSNKYLSHSFVESPDMKNVYDGVTEIDAAGDATVELPDYFMALNRDFRYQLTSIGAPAPLLHISQEIEDNRFRIAGGMPGTRVSWQVTGIRKDPYAVAHPIVVEQEKIGADKGRYLRPELYGQPVQDGIGYLPPSPSRPDSDLLPGASN